MFGFNDTGSARITVEVPKGFFVNYLDLLTVNYRNSAPESLAFIASIPGAKDWWIAPPHRAFAVVPSTAKLCHRATSLRVP